jgi:hypothetical protein
MRRVSGLQRCLVEYVVHTYVETGVHTEHPLLHQFPKNKKNGVAAAVVFDWRSIEMHNARWERIPRADCSGSGAGDTRRAVPQYISVQRSSLDGDTQSTGRVINRA